MYLAAAPKSNSMTQYFEAERVIQEEGAVLVFAAWFYLAG